MPFFRTVLKACLKLMLSSWSCIPKWKSIRSDRSGVCVFGLSSAFMLLRLLPDDWEKRSSAWLRSSAGKVNDLLSFRSFYGVSVSVEYESL